MRAPFRDSTLCNVYFIQTVNTILGCNWADLYFIRLKNTLNSVAEPYRTDVARRCVYILLSLYLYNGGAFVCVS